MLEAYEAANKFGAFIAELLVLFLAMQLDPWLWGVSHSFECPKRSSSSSVNSSALVISI